MKNYFKLIPKIFLYKTGSKIHIKKQNRGKFTEYCGGKVTQECIQKGKNSPDPKIRKRATFAENARKFKHQYGGTIDTTMGSGMNNYFQFVGNQNKAFSDQLNKESAKLERRKQLHEQELQKGKSIGDNFAKAGSIILGQGISALNRKTEAKGNETPPTVEEAQKTGNWFSDTLKPENNYSSLPTSIQTDIREKTTLPNSLPSSQTLLDQEMNKRKVQPFSFSNTTLSILKNKKGSKLIKKYPTHGWTSVLDDTGKVDKKTLKLRKHGKY